MTARCLFSRSPSPPRANPNRASLLNALRVRGATLTWEAEADVESGLAGFVVERDGKFLARVPDPGRNPFGRQVFQGLQYSDTPTQPLVPLRFMDPTARAGEKLVYRVTVVNTARLRSAPSPAAASDGAR